MKTGTSFSVIILLIFSLTAIASAADGPTFPGSVMHRVSGVPASPNVGGVATTVQSTNWAGYAVASSFSNPTASVNAINASWIVQSVPSTSATVFSAQWAGIGGFFSGDSTLIQTGTTSGRFNPGTGWTSYYAAWYEELPQSENGINSAMAVGGSNPGTVKPGDVMTANIALIPGTTNQWYLKLSDITQGWSYTNNTIVYNSGLLSGEFIGEAPQTCLSSCVQYPLPNFGTAKYGQDFTRKSGTNNVLLSGSNLDIGSQPNEVIDMVNGAGTIIYAEPRALTSDGSSFNLTYGTLNTPTVSPFTSVSIYDQKGSSITITGSSASGGYSPYTYSWVDSALGTIGSSTTLTFHGNLSTWGNIKDNVQQNSVTFDVTDSIGATASSKPVVISVAALPTAKLKPSKVTILHGNIEKYKITITNGFGPFNVELIYAANGVQVGSNVIIKLPGGTKTISFTPTTPGTYAFEAVVTDSGATTPYTFNSVANTITVT